MDLVLRVQKLANYQGLELPCYQSEQSSGVDLLAAVDRQGVVIEPGRRALIPTGLAIELPEGFEAQIRPRSGLALKYGITLLNTPGTIDADYRGEIGLIVINLGERPFLVERGMRIAQLVVSAVIRVTLEEADQLSDSERGSGGFGHSGF